MRTNGSHGPSGLNADEWCRILTVSKNSSLDISKTIESLARKIVNTEIDQSHMAPCNACSLITLDKNPSVRPIGVGEVLIRNIGRSIAALKLDRTPLVEIISDTSVKKAVLSTQSTASASLSRLIVLMLCSSSMPKVHSIV